MSVDMKKLGSFLLVLSFAAVFSCKVDRRDRDYSLDWVAGVDPESESPISLTAVVFSYACEILLQAVSFLHGHLFVPYGKDLSRTLSKHLVSQGFLSQ